MKVLLLLTVLLSGVLAITAAADEAVASTEAPVEENQVEAAPEAAPEESATSTEEAAASVEAEGGFFSCPSGWVRYKNGCFMFVTAPKSWSSAAAHCNSLGATLPSASSLFDYRFMQHLTMKSGRSAAWMGGFFFQTWRWLNQTPFTYNNWFMINRTLLLQCIRLNTRTGWINVSCHNELPFICMKRTF